MIILNYLFIGCICAFLLDYFSHKYQDHPSWQNVPDWDWGARIMFVLAWPLGVILFIYTFIKERFK
tara:strand:+ start:3154 stop:3351 length:198 start_codon:yes stop_codon:yes gene_type:complete